MVSKAFSGFAVLFVTFAILLLFSSTCIDDFKLAYVNKEMTSNSRILNTLQIESAEYKEHYLHSAVYYSLVSTDAELKDKEFSADEWSAKANSYLDAYLSAYKADEPNVNFEVKNGRLGVEKENDVIKATYSSEVVATLGDTKIKDKVGFKFELKSP